MGREWRTSPREAGRRMCTCAPWMASRPWKCRERKARPRSSSHRTVGRSGSTRTAP
jgi:hypothetical protein